MLYADGHRLGEPRLEQLELFLVGQLVKDLDLVQPLRYATILTRSVLGLSRLCSAAACGVALDTDYQRQQAFSRHQILHNLLREQYRDRDEVNV